MFKKSDVFARLFSLSKVVGLISIMLGIGDDVVTVVTQAEKEALAYTKEIFIQNSLAKAKYETARAYNDVPDFPPLSGTLEDFSNALTPDLPREWKLSCALTHIGLALSGNTSLGMQPGLMPRFYTVLIGLVGRGKSWVMNLVDEYLSPVIGKPVDGYTVLESIESGPALVDALDKHVAPNLFGGDTKKKLMLIFDEFTSLVARMKQTKDSRDTLSQSILSLYEKTSCANVTKKDGVMSVKDCHLALIGGVPANQWDKLWIGSSASQDGLLSRLVLAIESKPHSLPIERTPGNHKLALEVAARIGEQVKKANGLTIQVQDEAKLYFQIWWEDLRSKEQPEFLSRLDDMVKRFLMVLAVTNDTLVVGIDLMETATLFGDYQLEQRKNFVTQDAVDMVHAMEQKIVSYLTKNPKSSRSAIAKGINASRFPGEIFNRAMSALEGSHSILWESLGDKQRYSVRVVDSD